MGNSEIVTRAGVRGPVPKFSREVALVLEQRSEVSGPPGSVDLNRMPFVRRPVPRMARGRITETRLGQSGRFLDQVGSMIETKKPMKRKEYEKALRKLQVELCALQDWIRHS